LAVQFAQLLIFFNIDVDLHAHEAECQQNARFHELLFLFDWKNKRKTSFPFVFPSLIRIFAFEKQ
jgi:hypothetical protein